MVVVVVVGWAALFGRFSRQGGEEVVMVMVE